MRTISKEIRNEHNSLLQSETTRSTEGNSSVEISTDAKGNIKPSVKVYNDDPHVAKNVAVSIWNELKDAFGDKMLGEKATVEKE